MLMNNWESEFAWASFPTQVDWPTRGKRRRWSRCSVVPWFPDPPTRHNLVWGGWRVDAAFAVRGGITDFL